MNEHIFERRLDNVHVHQSGTITTDALHDTGQGGAAVLCMHVYFPQVCFALLVRRKIFNPCYTFESVCQLIMPASELQADNFLLVDAAFRAR